MLLICTATVCSARMYQWIDPTDATTQLSGHPPPWYRSSERGPRIFVFEQGRLVDDTGVRVSETERQRLRQAALMKVEEQRTIAKEKQLAQEQAREEKARQNAEVMEEKSSVGEGKQAEGKDTKQQEEELPSLEEMKSMIEAWEKRRSQDAKRSVEDQL